MDCKLVYITVANLDEAQKIGRELLHARLAACINIIDKVHSLYHWQGRLCEDKEVILIVKTQASLLSRLKTTVLGLHSYDCPCILVIPIEGGHIPFIEWVQRSTRSTSLQG